MHPEALSKVKKIGGEEREGRDKDEACCTLLDPQLSSERREPLRLQCTEELTGLAVLLLLQPEPEQLPLKELPPGQPNCMQALPSRVIPLKQQQGSFCLPLTV
ncbi:hypothetical protein MHYP_G00341750 [Metynnis hypsauchen]